MEPNKRKILIAKEIKTNIYLLLLSLLLSLVAFTYFYYDNEVNKFDDVFTSHGLTLDYASYYDPISERLLCCRLTKRNNTDEFIYFSGSDFPFIIYPNNNLRNIFERRRDYFNNKTIQQTKSSFLYILLLLILGRYVIIGLTWVFKTSNYNYNTDNETL